MTGLVVEFILLSSAIVVAGSFLARFADRLGMAGRLSGTITGVVLLATATSLPELAVSCTAALIPAPDLAMGDMLGSCLFNLLILAVLDLFSRTPCRMLSHTAAAHGLSATASILLTSTALLFILVRVPWSIGRISPGSVMVLLAYVLCLRLICLDQQLGQERLAETQHETPPRSIRGPLIGYLAMTLVIFLVAPRLAATADRLADASHLGGTFVGTVFVAIATSLPEVSTTREAVRMGAYDMAVGNILGSNSFNIVVLFAVAVFYAEPLFSAVSQTHAVTAVCVIIVTAALTMGLLYRAEKRWWVFEPDAVLVILLILVSFYLVYSMNE